MSEIDWDNVELVEGIDTDTIMCINYRGEPARVNLSSIRRISDGLFAASCEVPLPFKLEIDFFNNSSNLTQEWFLDDYDPDGPILVGPTSKTTEFSTTGCEPYVFGLLVPWPLEGTMVKMQVENISISRANVQMYNATFGPPPSIEGPQMEPEITTETRGGRTSMSPAEILTVSDISDAGGGFCIIAAWGETPASEVSLRVTVDWEPDTVFDGPIPD